MKNASLRFFRRFLCLLLLIGWLAFGARPTVIEAQSQYGPRLAFAAFKNGQWDLFSIAPDGQDLRQLTADPFEDEAPAFSPDGTQLAYASRRNNNWDLYLLDLSTGQETRLTTDAHYDGHPAWHPNGQQLAFESFRGGDLDVWLLDLTGQTELRNLTARSRAGEFDPAWGADGQLFFVSWAGDNNDIWTLDPTGGDWQQLTATVAGDTQPSWHSGTGRLAFTRNTLGDTDILLWDETTDAIMPYSWLGSMDSPAFSPDGQSLAGIFRRFDGAQLIRLDENNPIPHYLTAKAILRGPITWHPRILLSGSPVVSLETTDSSSLYVEDVTPSQSPYGEPYDLVRVANLQTIEPWLADTVDDSYQALRQAVQQEVGYDFLGQVSETLRSLDYNSDASQYASWHKSGRAFDTLFDWPGGRMEIVREDIGGETYWRILLRCLDQTGGCGRPLTANPWNYSSRARTVIAPEEGGIEKPNQTGYYLDFTTLAGLYGWERIASYDDEDFSWTWHFKAFEYWHYQKPLRNGLTYRNWYQAMLEVYPPLEVEEKFTWEALRALDEDPYIIVFKGIPLPPTAQRWWQALVPDS